MTMTHIMSLNTLTRIAKNTRTPGTPGPGDNTNSYRNDQMRHRNNPHTTLYHSTNHNNNAVSSGALLMIG